MPKLDKEKLVNFFHGSLRRMRNIFWTPYFGRKKRHNTHKFWLGNFVFKPVLIRIEKRSNRRRR